MVGNAEVGPLPPYASSSKFVAAAPTENTVRGSVASTSPACRTEDNAKNTKFCSGARPVASSSRTSGRRRDRGGESGDAMWVVRFRRGNAALTSEICGCGGTQSLSERADRGRGVLRDRGRKSERHRWVTGGLVPCPCWKLVLPPGCACSPSTRPSRFDMFERGASRIQFKSV